MDRRSDLDETRRLAYAALLSPQERSLTTPSLVATIVNALAHHGLAVDPAIAAGHPQDLVSDMPVNPGASKRWLQGQIDRITAELGSSQHHD